MSILKVSGVEKIYTTRFGGNQVEALKSVSFDVEQGEYVAIMGESGSGWSNSQGHRFFKLCLTPAHNGGIHLICALA